MKKMNMKGVRNGVNGLKSVRNTIFLLLSTLLSYATVGQDQTEYHYTVLGVDQGLGSEICVTAIEDMYGDLWIANHRELNRYNGYKTKIYQSYNSPISNKPLMDLTNDANGNVWILQTEDRSAKLGKHYRYNTGTKVTIVDPLTDHFYDFDDLFQEKGLVHNDILQAYFLNEKIIILTKQLHIYHYHKELVLTSKIPQSQNLIEVGHNGYYYEQKDSVYFHSFADSLSHPMFPATNRMGATRPENFHRQEIDKYSEQNHRTLYKVKNETFETIDLQKPYLDTIIINNDQISSYDPSDSLLIIYDGTSIYLNHDTRTINQVLDIKHPESKQFGITKTGLLLLASSSGLYILDIKNPPFHHLMKNPTKINSTTKPFITADISTINDRDHEYLSSPSGKYNFLKPTKTYFPHTHYLDTINQVFISSSIRKRGKNTLRKIDLTKGTTDFYDSGQTIVYGFYSDPKTHVLYGYGRATIYISKPPYLKFDVLDLPANDEIEIQNYNHIIRSGKYLLLAIDQGILFYNDSLRRIEKQKIFGDKIRSIQFLHIDKDDSDIIWFGTYGNGLFKWNRVTDDLIRYSKSDGLSNPFVHSVHEDTHGRLWIPTNNNLNCLEKESDNITVFTTADGIAHSEFNRHGYFYNHKTGNIYYGGLDGYTYFNPDKIDLSQYSNKTPRIISAQRFKRDFSTMDISTEVIPDNKVKITSSDSYVQISFSTNHLLSIEDTDYSYRLSNLSEEWIKLDGNQIRLSNLPFGSHTLEVIADRNKSLKKQQPIQIAVDVIPPFYRSLWFILACICLGILLFTLISNYRSKRIIAANKNLKTMVSLRTEELENANDFKNKIFAILSHDLRGPISSLSNLTRKIEFLINKNRTEEVIAIAQLTEKKVSALNLNLNNILSWTEIESTSFNPEQEVVDIQNQIDTLSALFVTSISKKQLQLQVDISSDLQIKSDQKIAQTILRNAFQNAIKFAPNQSSIVINGEGNIVSLTNRYSESECNNPSNIGTGLGLKIIEEISTLANIKTELVVNDQGKTTFSINFPKND